MPFRIEVPHSYACVYLCVYIYICTQILHKTEKKCYVFQLPYFLTRLLAGGLGYADLFSFFFFYANYRQCTSCCSYGSDLLLGLTP